MRRNAVLLALALSCVGAFGQAIGGNGVPGANSGGPTPFAGVPTGSCASTQTAVNTLTGDFYSCVGGAWNKINGTSGPPSGAAGGSLSGTYPNPGLASTVAIPSAATATTQTTGDSSTKLANDAFVAATIAAYAPLASPTFTGTPAAPTPATSDSSTKVATTAYVQSVQADPYLQRTQTLLFDDYYSTANNSANPIGSPTGSGCSANNVDSDINHPGNIVLTTGTGGTGTGETCGYQNASGAVHTLNLTPGWTWETDVYVPVLPGTTAASYQVGLSGSPNSNPWGTSILFYLSSANGVANDWYCKYSSTSVDTGVAAVASTWTVLRMASDGTNTHWYINGTEASGCVTASSNLTATSVYVASYAATALGSTSTTMAVDYVYFQRAVTR